MDNRAALRGAALSCLEQHGYAATTARMIASTAGVSLGAIGYHFGSTQALLDEALSEAVRRWTEPLIARLAGPELITDGAALAGRLVELLSTFEANRPIAVAYFEALLHAQRDPVLRDRMARDYQDLRTALTQVIGARLAPGTAGTTAETVATLLMATFDGLILQWLLDPDRLPSGQQLSQTLTWATGLVASPGRPATARKAASR